MDLKLNFKAYHKMYIYCRAAKGETSAWGRTVFNNGDVIVTDVKALAQHATSATVDLTDDALTDFIFDLATKHREDFSNWNFWFHTHNNFAVGWSGRDEENIEEHSQKMPLVSLCMNKRGDMTARVDFKGVRTDFDRIVVCPTGHNGLTGRYQREIKRKVRNVRLHSAAISN